MMALAVILGMSLFVVMVLPRVVVMNAPIVNLLFVVFPKVVVENEPVVIPTWVFPVFPKEWILHRKNHIFSIVQKPPFGQDAGFCTLTKNADLSVSQYKFGSFLHALEKLAKFSCMQWKNSPSSRYMKG